MSLGNPAAGNGLSPEALYELRLDTVRRFINHVHANRVFFQSADIGLEVDLTTLTEGFLKGETK